MLASTGTPQLQAATSDLSAWNTAMLQASYTDGHVMLPDSVAWPTLHSPVLFVRDFYKPFFDDVLNGLRRNSSSISEKCVAIAKVVVCGNPGIGKSAFGMYALFRALKDGRAVVYASAKQLTKGLARPPLEPLSRAAASPLRAFWPNTAMSQSRYRLAAGLVRGTRRGQATRASGSCPVCQTSEPQVFRQCSYVSRWQPRWRKRL